MKKIILLRYVFLFLISIAFSSHVFAFEVCKTGYGDEIKWLSSYPQFWVNPAGGPLGSLSAIWDAAGTWSDVDTAAFTFNSGSTTNNPDPFEWDGENVIGFASFSFLGLSDAVARNFYNYNTDTGEIVESDIILNTDYDWATDGSQDKFDVQNVATHELGHSLCLENLYDTSDSEKTMFWVVPEGETKKRTLHQDDMDGITYLYHFGPIASPLI